MNDQKINSPPKQLDIFLDEAWTPPSSAGRVAAKPRLLLIGGGRDQNTAQKPELKDQAIWDAVLKRASKLGW